MTEDLKRERWQYDRQFKMDAVTGQAAGNRPRRLKHEQEKRLLGQRVCGELLQDFEVCGSFSQKVSHQIGEETRMSVFEYIETFYNRQRKHISPDKFERCKKPKRLNVMST
jgi:hypothetical protein